MPSVAQREVHWSARGFPRKTIKKILFVMCWRIAEI